MGDSFKAYREAFGPKEDEYYSTQLNQRYFNVYRAFQEQGVRGFCDTCHQWKSMCVGHLEDGSTECVDCCIKRLQNEAQRMLAGLDKPEPKPKPEPLKNFDLEDFCRL